VPLVIVVLETGFLLLLLGRNVNMWRWCIVPTITVENRSLNFPKRINVLVTFSVFVFEIPMVSLA
jgi:hypothetical protein